MKHANKFNAIRERTYIHLFSHWTEEKLIQKQIFSDIVHLKFVTLRANWYKL